MSLDLSWDHEVAFGYCYSVRRFVIHMILFTIAIFKCLTEFMERIFPFWNCGRITCECSPEIVEMLVISGFVGKDCFKAFDFPYLTGTVSEHVY